MEATITRRDSVLYTHKLANGLQMVGQRIPGVQSAAIVFWVLTGTRDETKSEMGVSHFLEHMAFQGTESRTSEQIDHEWEEMGADHNAFTSLEMTAYWARVLSENVSWGIDVVADITHPALHPENFDQERQVILEEIARAEDSPTHVLIDYFMRDYFGEHPLSWETLGTLESIKALTVDQMRAYWRRRYGTRNMIFAIAGNFVWEDVVRQLETLTAQWEQGEPGRILSSATFNPGSHVYTRGKFVQEQIAIGIPSVPRSDPRYFAAAVLATILGDDTGSRLFWSLHQTGLAESATAQVMEFEDNGVMLIHLSTDPDKVDEAVRVARADLQRLQDFDVQQDELDRAKAKLISSVIIGGESTNERVFGLIQSWLTEGRVETLEEVHRKIEEVDLEALRALVHACPVAPHQVITAVGPLSESELSLSA